MAKIQALPGYKKVKEVVADHPEADLYEGFVSAWAREHHVLKHSGVYMFTPEQEEEIVNYRKNIRARNGTDGIEWLSTTVAPFRANINLGDEHSMYKTGDRIRFRQRKSADITSENKHNMYKYIVLLFVVTGILIAAVMAVFAPRDNCSPYAITTGTIVDIGRPLDGSDNTYIMSTNYTFQGKYGFGIGDSVEVVKYPCNGNQYIPRILDN